MLFFIIALAGVGVAVAATAGSGGGSLPPGRKLIPIDPRFFTMGPKGPVVPTAPDYDKIAKEFAAAEKRANEERDRRDVAAEKEAKGYGDYLAVIGNYFGVGPFVKAMWGYFVDLSIEYGKQLADLLYKDPGWNNEANKARAQRAAAALIERGFVPPMPVAGMTDDFHNWAKAMEFDLVQLAGVEKTHPREWSTWMDVVRFVGMYPNDNAVRDVQSIPNGYKPPLPSFPSTVGAMQNKKSATALAIATLIARVRGYPAEPVRRYVYNWHTQWVPTNQKELFWADRRGSMLAGIIMAANRAIDEKVQ